MLYVSLVFSALLLGFFLTQGSRSGSLRTVATLSGVTIGLCVLAGALFPALVLHWALLLVVALLSRWRGWSPMVFVALSLAATVTAYVPGAWLAYNRQARLLATYPAVSIEDRLPLPRADTSEGTLSPRAGERLIALETRLEDQPFLSRRLRSLQKLHEHSVSVFVESPGFGAARMRRTFELSLPAGQPDNPPVPQPSLAPSWETPERPAGSLSEMHEEAVLDFLNPLRFGYFQDRRRVAGFEEHQFSVAPRSRGSARLEQIDLVGLLLHETPVAYVSRHLPRMDELRGAPTRALDEFESEGLGQLRQGEDLWTRQEGDVTRLLGSIRTARQCVDCHGGQRGDLLGAFSYRLREAE